ncbi:MAG TPA: NGG1p interacting factor NIF3, partial [Thermodesulfovibrionales bacterium]|nr:NGG1p interacting factor NIF3 [Thermodesulfovibrionales bacterium]
MKLREFYHKAIEIGLENDPRGKETALKDLDTRKKEFDSLKEEEKAFFDKETLTNPYSDSRILNGTGEEVVRSILVGIDVEVAEILLCDRLREKGKDIDAVVAHHPGGRAYANLYDVMRIQSDILHRFGVPISTAEDLMDGRIKEVERKLMPVNHTRAVDAAKLLDVPFVCFHTPADNMVATHLQKTFEEKSPYTIADVMDILRLFPEYREAAQLGTGPKILIGSKTRKAGKIFVDMTGGTEGSKDIFESIASSGINTIVAMHFSEDHRKEAEKSHLNVVIAGHISSDNLGMN